ncbi:type II and III secretion system protein family protein [Pacificimonas sp. WHA3]|uniref:Type II and III secretion system protein family protein n=1 Tax=Pacificimonas pallii TaxID=2827236 RepID=A0ABS6SAD6_9SPHN|nr:type II and III secretion system protein family protein [Pacificimonas pallii]MBV7255246.1 type II and III secretion system protein family protein [Pacificimonas pallii]
MGHAILKKTFLATAAVAASLTMTAMPMTAGAQTAQTILTTPDSVIELSQGKGTLVTLPKAISDIFVVNQGVADVQVKSQRQVYVFAQGPGETSLYATDARGQTIYSATIRVSQNIDQLREMLRLAMPASDVNVMTMNGMTLLTGTVASPEEIGEATRLINAFTGGSTVVVNKLQAAIPAQVNLRVRFAEVSRNVLKQLGVSFTAFDGSSDLLLGIARGRKGITGPKNIFTTRPELVGDTKFVTNDATSSLFGVGSLFGVDFNATVDALENDGLLTLLAEPNLTALSGETASFLAGGEFPIVTYGRDGPNVQFKEYGVSIAFSPTVLADNRISMRVRPEVSELTEAGSVRLNDISIPALTTRKAETSVELGSGQSFMIGGLTRNSFTTSTEKIPFLGDIPILGALFKSDTFRRDETELVIVITPYLVKPVSQRLALPTDGLAAPSDAERWLLGRTYSKGRALSSDAKIVTPEGPAGTASAKPGFSVQ